MQHPQNAANSENPKTRTRRQRARFLPANGRVLSYQHVRAWSQASFAVIDARSPLLSLCHAACRTSVPACQSIVKKAVIARLLSAEPSRNIDQDAQGWLRVRRERSYLKGRGHPEWCTQTHLSFVLGPEMLSVTASILPTMHNRVTRELA